MKVFFTFLIIIASVLLAAGISYSQAYCIPGRFDTTYIFSSLQIDTLGNIPYGINFDENGDIDTLKFIIALPNIDVDPLTKKPFILLIHGGGFMDGDKYDMKPVMLDFAMRGYVCASIDYRLGWATGIDPLHCTGDGYSMAQAVYRAMQDAKAALRYFANKADTYGIDTGYIFAGGISAGAVTSLMIQYATQTTINSVYPNLVNELGSLDSADNSLQTPFSVKCLLSSSGGIFDTIFIRLKNSVPVLMFHGTADSTVPYLTGYAYSCSNYIRTEGSGEIVKRYRSLIKPFELDYVPGGGHENFYPLSYIQLRSILFLKRFLCNDRRQIIIENYSTLLDTSLNLLTKIGNPGISAPENFILYQNYPNPFNPSTKIKFELKQDGRLETEDVKLSLYDITGKEIATLLNKSLQPGAYEVTFDGSGFPSGIYFYKLITGKFTSSRKMILIK